MPFDSKQKKSDYEREYASRPNVLERKRQNFKVWREGNREHVAAMGARRRLEKRGQLLISNARARARKRGLPFDLDSHISDIQRRLDLGICELTGEAFDFSPRRKFNSPSIDRIVPSKGYVYDNIRVVLFMVNIALGDWGEDELRRVMGIWMTQSVSLRSRRSSNRISKVKAEE